ncbi:hypothetical protein M7I_1537 [Glarea lozoyensis 74030]|uniref:DUF8035 domain-containing protein n=1 Tax=Glarea lozoyensis (strain ATCC 74030 / MF5533) TaxID=1104152 RepID=H0EGC2_GLAL7|nr:hypothetical protein M7I_1537 [Glarea lozoyensis 74030]
MSQYRSSVDHLAYGPGPERWDSERFNQERDRDRFGRGDGGRYDQRDTKISINRTNERGGPGRPRERSVDEIYERDRRGPRGYEDDFYERRHYHEDEPRLERERPIGRNRGQSITLERERERFDEPPVRRGSNRPAFLRRQSSLDTFDRKPLTRFNDRERLDDYGPPARFEREEYGPPARYERREEMRPPALTPIPLPVRKALGPPPRRYEEREYYEDIKVAEPDFYGDEEFRGYPERVREREIIRRRRRSRSKESRAGRSVRGGGSVRSSSRSSSSSSGSFETVRNEFPKKGKTRMPARLVSKKAIIDLGYPFEEEGDTIIIMKALGRENIDEVIKLSEDYKSEKHSPSGNVVFEESRTTEVITVPSPAPPPPPPVFAAPPVFAPPPPMPAHEHVTEVIKDTRIVDVHRDPSPAYSHRSHSRHSHHHHGSHGSPIIMNAGPREESTFIEKKREVIERSDPMPVGPLALALPNDRRRVPDERSIRAEIKALEAEKEALKAQRRADREIRRADRYRGEGRHSESELVVYDRERYDTYGDEVTMVRTERFVEPEGGVKIQKDKKGRMSISVPKYI